MIFRLCLPYIYNMYSPWAHIYKLPDTGRVIYKVKWVEPTPDAIMYSVLEDVNIQHDCGDSPACPAWHYTLKREKFRIEELSMEREWSWKRIVWRRK